MNLWNHFTHSVSRVSVAVGSILLALCFFWAYRVWTAEESAQFAPVNIKLASLPTGTEIEAVIRDGIASSAVAGDKVTAFVSQPVIFDGRLVIPSGAALKGNLEKLSKFGASGRADINFTVLFIRDRSFPIQTRRVVVITPLISDTDILATAFATLVGGTLGAAIAAASGDGRMIDRGLLAGGTASVSVKTVVPITVSLTDDLEI
jgi:hypothetical protein